jgi:hypothetical protein
MFKKMKRKVVIIEGSDNDVAAVETALAFVNNLIASRESRMVSFAVDGFGGAMLRIKDEDGTVSGVESFDIPLQPNPKGGYKANPVGQIDGMGNLTVDLGG